MKSQQSLNDSKKYISQNSRLFNETVVSPIQVDASMTKTSRKRYAVNNHLSRNTLDLGQFNESKLSALYQSSYEQEQKGEVICLAYIDKQKNSQITINPQATTLFRKYEKNPITFVGNFGKKQSGKSFWYDKILNLTQIEGAQYSKIQNNPGLYIWSVPFVKNDLRIFLIDYSNDKQGENLSGEGQKLLDLQLILSEIMVLVPEPEDKKMKVADAAYTNFNSTMSRLNDKGSKTNKQTAYWPHSLYNLYRSIKTVSPQTDKLSYLFSNYNYSIIHNAKSNKLKQSVSQLSLMESSIVKRQNSNRLLNQKYVKRTSLVFKDIYSKLHGKKYEGLGFTGELLPYILGHSVKNINSSKNIKMEKMFNQIKKQIYERKLQAGKFVYNLNYDMLKQNNPKNQNQKTALNKKDSKNSVNLFESRKIDSVQSLKNSQKKQNTLLIGTPQKNSKEDISRINNPETQIPKPKPRPLDQVLEIFRKTNQSALDDFNATKYDAALHEDYEKKLLQYGQLKQKQVIDYNKKQTYNILASTLPTFTEPKDVNDLESAKILAFLANLKTQGMPLDHDRCKPVSQKLKDLCVCAKRHKFFHVWMTEEYYRQRKLQMNMEDKQKQLRIIKQNAGAVVLMNSHHDNKASELLDQHNRSTDKIEQLKGQVDFGKRRNRNGITDQEYLQQLQKNKLKLEETLRDNNKKIREVDLTPSKDPRISILRQKVEDKKQLELQVSAGLSNLAQSRLNNTSSILTSRKAHVRKVGQGKGTSGGIRKSHLNKSMTK